MSPKSVKARRAVLVSAVPDEHTIRILLDDVVSDIQLPKNWIQREHITSKEVSRSSFERADLDEKELADFGHYILARLSAFLERREL